MKIVLTGATGLVGRRLLIDLQEKGHTLFALARDPSRVTELPQSRVFRWSGSGGPPPPESLRGMDAVIHLAGESVAGARWTESRKKAIRESRVAGTRNLVEAIGRLSAGERPGLLISASAIGIYEEREGDSLSEDAARGEGFLAETVKQWEEEALKAEELGLRVCLPRLGVVLAPEGGALAQMAPVILGSGRQWFSWVHIGDLLGFVDFVLNNPGLKGAFNLTAPFPVTNEDLTGIFSRVLGYPFVFRAPAFALRWVLGEMSGALLGSLRVIPEKAQKAGFVFDFPDLESALEDLYPSGCHLDSVFRSAQFVPGSMEEVFSFFSQAENLGTITPPWLNFRITGIEGKKMGEGTLISYRLKIHGVPVHWQTEITQWQPEWCFVDVQRKGPYRKWEHTHQFLPVEGGVLITDEILYRLPFKWAGKLAGGKLVAKDVKEIFLFRQRRIRELFG